MEYQSSAVVDPSVEERKLFIGGLGWDTTDTEGYQKGRSGSFSQDTEASALPKVNFGFEQLSEYFAKYGEIESINVKTNPNTGRSRGFAFIVFQNMETVDTILNSGEHVINGRKIDPKKAIARTGKIFVGGLKPEIPDEDIKNHFGQYGKVIDVEFLHDKAKNQRKGFCFVTFEQEQVVNDLLKNPKQTIGGHSLDLRKAAPKLDALGGRGGFMGGPPTGGRGGTGGRGSYAGGRGRGYGYPSPYGYPPYGGGSYGGGNYDYGNYGSYGGGYGSGYGSGYDYSNGYNGYDE